MDEDEDLTAARDRIVSATLPHIAFEGLTEKAMRAGVEDAGFGEGMFYRAFPDGMRELVIHWSDYANRRMEAAVQERDDLEELDVGERIAAAVRARLELDEMEKHAVRRISSYLALPTNASLAAKLTYKTVDAMWYAVGDTSTDISFYSKRAMLAAVYSATVLYWLNDESEESEETWAFLDRMLSGVMRFKRLPSFRPPNPLDLLSAPLAGLRDRFFRQGT
jgi:ubiquinone biosynthesis protein COQ9